MRSLTLITLCVLVLIMVSGCLMFYTGSDESPFKVVAVRNEPGRPQEAILQSECRANWEVGDMEGAGKAYQELIARAPYRFQRHGSWFEDMDLVIPALGGAHAKELIEMG